MADDYELVPGKIVSNLKQDIDNLKRNPLGGTDSGKDLLKSISNLNESLNTMTCLFKEAAESLKLEEKEEEVLSKKIDPMMRQITMIVDQNKKIAQGIVAIADMVSEMNQRIDSMQSQTQKPKQQSLRQMASEAPQYNDQSNNQMDPYSMQAQQGFSQGYPQGFPQGDSSQGLPPISPSEMMPPSMDMPSGNIPQPGMPSSQSPFEFKPLGPGADIEGKAGLPPMEQTGGPLPSLRKPEKPKKGFGSLFK